MSSRPLACCLAQVPDVLLPLVCGFLQRYELINLRLVCNRFRNVWAAWTHLVCTLQSPILPVSRQRLFSWPTVSSLQNFSSDDLGFLMQHHYFRECSTHVSEFRSKSIDGRRLHQLSNFSALRVLDIEIYPCRSPLTFELGICYFPHLEMLRVTLIPSGMQDGTNLIMAWVQSTKFLSSLETNAVLDQRTVDFLVESDSLTNLATYFLPTTDRVDFSGFKEHLSLNRCTVSGSPTNDQLHCFNVPKLILSLRCVNDDWRLPDRAQDVCLRSGVVPRTPWSNTNLRSLDLAKADPIGDRASVLPLRNCLFLHTRSLSIADVCLLDVILSLKALETLEIICNHLDLRPRWKGLQLPSRLSSLTLVRGLVGDVAMALEMLLHGKRPTVLSQICFRVCVLWNASPHFDSVALFYQG